jgi:hypothetical protein
MLEIEQIRRRRVPPKLGAFNETRRVNRNLSKLCNTVIVCISYSRLDWVLQCSIDKVYTLGYTMY